MSCSSPTAWITDPAPRNSRALKAAWVARWKTAKSYWDSPQAKTMYPSWEQVE